VQRHSPNADGWADLGAEEEEIPPLFSLADLETEEEEEEVEISFESLQREKFPLSGDSDSVPDY
jgi:hypothetical protein